MARRRRQISGPVCVAATLIAFVTSAASEVVNVKYRGPVDVSRFDCKDVTQSSFVRRVCYDARESYMIVRLNETYYHYCEIDRGTVDALLTAESVGRFYNARIKGDGKDGPFDCRTRSVPR